MHMYTVADLSGARSCHPLLSNMHMKHFKAHLLHNSCKFILYKIKQPSNQLAPTTLLYQEYINLLGSNP